MTDVHSRPPRSSRRRRTPGLLCYGASAAGFLARALVVTDKATGQVAGHSLIEPIHAGCAVRETYTGQDGFEGGSTSLWDREAGEWVQFGTGSTGARMLFSGQWEDGSRMSLMTTRARTGRPALLIRMRLEPITDGRVRQWSEMSSDHGETWRTRYDYIYAPAP